MREGGSSSRKRLVVRSSDRPSSKEGRAIFVNGPLYENHLRTEATMMITYNSFVPTCVVRKKVYRYPFCFESGRSVPDNERKSLRSSKELRCPRFDTI
jgi:hypothetical protein